MLLNMNQNTLALGIVSRIMYNGDWRREPLDMLFYEREMDIHTLTPISVVTINLGTSYFNKIFKQ
jgi:hypothetical protein